jgi:hypothetical protein
MTTSTTEDAEDTEFFTTEDAEDTEEMPRGD